jgi:type I restriction enzyme R subunit
LDTSAGGSDPQVMLKDRLDLARERLDAAFEALHLLCQPVLPPQGDLDHIHYFCGNTEMATDLQEREPQRVAMYKAVVALIRAWANAADELEGAGYSPQDVDRMKAQLKHYLDLRDLVRQAAGETLDLKAYEADMRHLIDTYIEASAPRKISPFDDIGLLDLIVKTGIAEAIANKLANVKNNHEAVAESIENNVRSKLIKEQLTDPAFFERMSALLDEIIRLRKQKAIEYEEYLQRIATLTRQVMSGKTDDTPKQLNTPGRLALYNNLKVWVTTNTAGQPHAPYGGNDATVAIVMALDASIKEHRPDSWRGVTAKEQLVKQAIYNVIKDIDAVNRIYPIVFAHKEY